MKQEKIVTENASKKSVPVVKNIKKESNKFSAEKKFSASESINKNEDQFKSTEKPFEQIIMERKNEKINQIIDNAVKRAIKFNKVKPVTTPTKPTTPKPNNKFRNFDPIFNPITGLPIGLVRKTTGEFFPIKDTFEKESSEIKSSSNHPGLENFFKLMKLKDNKDTSSKLTFLKIDEDLTPKYEDLSKEDISARKVDYDPFSLHIDTSLDSLTEEFHTLMHGERSSIYKPDFKHK